MNTLKAICPRCKKRVELKIVGVGQRGQVSYDESPFVDSWYHRDQPCTHPIIEENDNADE